MSSARAGAAPIVALAVMQCCSVSDATARQWQRDLTPFPAAPATVHLSARQPRTPTGALTWVATLEAVPVRWRFGTEDGRPETVFGQIGDVAVAADGSILVLDSRLGDVRLLSPAGTFLQTIGRAGNGPGEFARPSAIALDARGRLFVADFARRLHTFERDSRGRYAFVRTVSLPVAAEDMCFLGAELYIHGFDMLLTELIHRVDSSGRILQSFGAIYRSVNPWLNHAVSAGWLACHNETGTIVFAPKGIIPEIRSYRHDGTPLWRVRIGGFRPTIVEELPGGGIRFSGPPEGTHIVSALVPVPSGVMAQVRVVGATQPSSPGSDLVVIDARTGQASVLRWPSRVLGAAGRGWYVAIETDSVPIVGLWSSARTR